MASKWKEGALGDVADVSGGGHITTITCIHTTIAVATIL